MFADDLLMFCKGDATSIILLMRAFSSFSQTSGLRMNNTKSEIYFNGMRAELKREIRSVTGFTEGTMPFRYLGVPIQAGRLTKKECSCITEKLIARIRGLGAKKLSYAGRITLINSVLNSLYTYWASMFLIPKSVIKRIEAICRNFLWDGSSEYHRVPLVAWDTATLPKEEGGLGIKKPDLWNIATVGKLVDWVYSNADRLWIKWIHQVYIKNQRWHEYKPPPTATWSWKHICKVKELIKEGFVNDVWHINAQGYSIKNGYNWLRSPQPVKEWTNIVWNNWNTPKHSIITWIAMNGGLNIKARLIKFGCCTDDLCCLCCMDSETADHLFVSCAYSCRVRKAIGAWIGRALPTVSMLLTCNRKNTHWKLFAAVTNAINYHVWLQRNNARVNGILVRPEVIAKQIKAEVTKRIKYKLGSNSTNLPLFG